MRSPRLIWLHWLVDGGDASRRSIGVVDCQALAVWCFATSIECMQPMMDFAAGKAAFYPRLIRRFVRFQKGGFQNENKYKEGS